MITMKNKFWEKMFKTSILYLLGSVIAKLVSFFMLPLYTNKIPADIYGTYDIVVAYAAIVIPLIGVNCWQGMLRFTVEEPDVNKRHSIVSQGWMMLLLSGITFTIGYGIFCIFVPLCNKELIYCYYIVQMVQYFYLYTVRGFSKNKVYAISGIISAVVVAVTSIICIYWFNLTIETLYIAMIVSLLAQIFYMEINVHLLKDINYKKVNREQIKGLYKYCFPESIGTIFNWFLSNANRIIIVAILGYSANGIYAISNKFLAILNVFMTAFVLAFQESIYAAGSENIEEVGNDVLKKFSQISGIAVAFILIGTSIIYPFFVTGEYVEGYKLIPLFYLYFLASGVTWILSSIVSATKKTKIILYEKVIIGSINFSLMALLIGKIGLSSSPIALFMAEIIGIAVFKILLKKKANCIIQIPIRELLMDAILIIISAIFFFINNLCINLMIILLSGIGLFLIYGKKIYQIIKISGIKK